MENDSPRAPETASAGAPGHAGQMGAAPGGAPNAPRIPPEGRPYYLGSFSKWAGPTSTPASPGTPPPRPTEAAPTLPPPLTAGGSPSPIEGMLALRISDLPAGTQAWLKSHRLTPREVAAALLDLAALGQWQLAEKMLADPRARELVAYVAAAVLLEAQGSVSQAELADGYRGHLEGKGRWPGDRRVHVLLVAAMLALFGLRRCNSVKRQGVAVRGWRGARLAAPAPLLGGTDGSQQRGEAS